MSPATAEELGSNFAFHADTTREQNGKETDIVMLAIDDILGMAGEEQKVTQQSIPFTGRGHQTDHTSDHRSHQRLQV